MRFSAHYYESGIAPADLASEVTLPPFTVTATLTATGGPIFISRAFDLPPMALQPEAVTPMEISANDITPMSISV